MTHDVGLEFLQQRLGLAASGLTWAPVKEWPTWAIALAFGLASSISFPIGAIAGLTLSPVNETYVAAFVAFGAGALLFAVTVELYGVRVALLETEGYHDGALEVTVLVGFAILGAWSYLLLNRWMDSVVVGPDEDESMPLRGSAGATKPMTQRSSTSASAQSSVLSVRSQGSKMTAISERTPRQKALVVMMSPIEKEKRLKFAMAMWLGVFVDGLSESILLGFLAAEHRLSVVMVLSLFVANFPEAFSGASMLREASPETPSWKIISMWTLLTLMTGGLATLACICYPVGDVPFWVHVFSAAIEGLCGGAMLACIAAIMLPQAYEIQGDIIGLICVTGFLLAVLIKVYGGVVSEIGTSGTWGGAHRATPVSESQGHHFLHGLFFFL